MAEAFKNYFDHALITTMADIFARRVPGFESERFCALAGKGLNALELKARAYQIMLALDATVPTSSDALEAAIHAVLHPSEDPGADDAAFGPEGIMGFAAWPLTDLVTHRLIDVPARALPMLKEVTKRFSAEFAIRPFLDCHTDFTLELLRDWAVDPNRHVRRLVSEGTRPRLPWGMRLKRFVADPSPIIPLLELLKGDEEEYVRRSVANNLNDIAKDHPDLVAGIASTWLGGAAKNTERLVRHGCRSLIKQGHKGVLAAFGYAPIPGLDGKVQLDKPAIALGEALAFELSLEGGRSGAPVMVDYAIHFVKANGRRVPKVFKWKDTRFDADTLKVHRQHAIRPITTRVYYPGTHLLEIIVNGVSVATKPFDLEIPGRG